MLGSIDEVYALSGTYIDKMEAENTAVVTVKFQGGALATIVVVQNLANSNTKNNVEMPVSPLWTESTCT